MSILIFLVVVSLILIWKVAEDLETMHHEMSIITMYFREINEIYSEWVDREKIKDQSDEKS